MLLELRSFFGCCRYYNSFIIVIVRQLYSLFTDYYRFFLTFFTSFFPFPPNAQLFPEEETDVGFRYEDEDNSTTTNLALIDASPLPPRRPVSPTTSALYKRIEALERKIKENSAILVEELALRDELEDEKEVKNEFISLLIAVQNKRRISAKNNNNNNNNDVKRRNRMSLMPSSSSSSFEQQQQQQQQSKQQRRRSAIFGASVNDTSSAAPQLQQQPRVTPPPPTAVVPYDETAPIDVPLLRIFIRILTAIRDESTTVPALLTDYILKVLCPRTKSTADEEGRMRINSDAKIDDIVHL